MRRARKEAPQADVEGPCAPFGARAAEGIRQNGPRRPQVIDLFAGVGGMSLGAVRAGFHLALAVDLDEQAMAAHQRNFPTHGHLFDDISHLDGAKLIAAAGVLPGELDGLIGGPPCQGFSVIGNRCAVDPRNNLFVHFFQLVAECRPMFFVAENVLGILDARYDDIRARAQGLVDDDYTVLDPIRLKASDFGVPTSRERVFFVGYRSDAVRELHRCDFRSNGTLPVVMVAEALRGLPQRIRSDWLTEARSWRVVAEAPQTEFWQRITGEIPDGVGDAEALRRYSTRRLASGCFGTRHSPKVRARYRRLKQGQKDRVSKAVRLKPDGFCPTLRAGTGFDKGRYQAVRPIHPTESRVITPREAARLQGFPDWFRFAPSKWHSFRQLGNSVSPIVAEAVLRVIRERLLERP